MSSARLSDALKEEIRSERIGKESFEKTLSRMLDERKVMHGEYGKKTKDQYGAIKEVMPLLREFGVHEREIGRVLTDSIKELKNNSILREREDIGVMVFSRKIKSIEHLILCAGSIGLVLMVLVRLF